MTGGSAAGAGVAVGTPLAVAGLVTVVLGLVAASRTLGPSGSALVGLGTGVAAAAVLVGLSMLAMSGTLLFGPQ